jgi:hypothetical protein
MNAARSARRTIMFGSAGVVVDRVGFAGGGSACEIVAGATI